MSTKSCGNSVTADKRDGVNNCGYSVNTHFRLSVLVYTSSLMLTLSLLSLFLLSLSPLSLLSLPDQTFNSWTQQFTKKQSSVQSQGKNTWTSSQVVSPLTLIWNYSLCHDLHIYIPCSVIDITGIHIVLYILNTSWTYETLRNVILLTYDANTAASCNTMRWEGLVNLWV